MQKNEQLFLHALPQKQNSTTALILAIIPGHYTVVSDCFRHGGPSSFVLVGAMLSFVEPGLRWAHSPQ